MDVQSHADRQKSRETGEKIDSRKTDSDVEMVMIRQNKVTYRQFIDRQRDRQKDRWSERQVMNN